MDVKIAIQIGSYWSQMGQIWDFLRSVSVHFGSHETDLAEPKCTETDLENDLEKCPILTQLRHSVVVLVL